MENIGEYEKTIDALDAWKKGEKTSENAELLLQDAYLVLENENCHSNIEAIEFLTGIKMRGEVE